MDKSSETVATYSDTIRVADCGYCDGTGAINGRICASCEGAGIVTVCPRPAPHKSGCVS